MSFLEVRPLSAEEELISSNGAIGKAICPSCGKEILVIKKEGDLLHARIHFLESHNLDESPELCPASEKYAPVLLTDKMLFT